MNEPQLRRDIGLAGSSLLTFNGIVGAGIFALPATLAAGFGAFSPWLFPLFGLSILLIAIPFARLASLVSISGGPVAYVAPFGTVASFQVGWAYYIARLTSFAANVTVFATYAAALIPSLGGAVAKSAVIVAVIAFVTWINVVGVRRAIRILDVATALKLLPLIAVVGWALVTYAAPTPPAMPPIGELEAVALLVLYAFIGFENSVVPAEETKQPQKTIPRALVGTVAATVILYFLVQLAYVAVVPAGEKPEAPLARMAEVMFGPVGIVVISITAMASVLANNLGSMTSTPRVTFALAEKQLLPGWFARVHRAWGTPANSIIFYGLAGVALALTGSFLWLAIVSTLARLAVYAASLLALPAASRSANRRLGIGLGLVALAGVAVCIWAAAQADVKAWAMLAALLAVGLLLYLLAHFGRKAAV